MLAPPHRAKGAPSARRGEGLGVGGIPTSIGLQSPPPSLPHKGGGIALYIVERSRFQPIARAPVAGIEGAENARLDARERAQHLPFRERQPRREPERRVAQQPGRAAVRLEERRQPAARDLVERDVAPLTIPGDDALTVKIDPTNWFKIDNQVLDLVSLNGQLVELEDRFVAGISGTHSGRH